MNSGPDRTKFLHVGGVVIHPHANALSPRQRARFVSTGDVVGICGPHEA